MKIMTERQSFRIFWWAGLTGFTLAVLSIPIVDMTGCICFLLVWLWYTPYFNNIVFSQDQNTKTIKSVFQRRQYQRRRRTITNYDL